MTAPTLAPSAYPSKVEDLIPDAIELAKDTGKVPSRNALMKEFHIGVPKATALREALDELAKQDEERMERFRYQLQRGRNVPAPELKLSKSVPELVSESEAVTVVYPEITIPDAASQLKPVGHPDIDAVPAAEPAEAEVVTEDVEERRPVVWPVLILCLPAFVAIWAGWVEMGRLTGFGKVTLLPGISDFQIDTAITLPIGVETYAAYALWAWLSGRLRGQARQFAKWSAIASLAVGALGQIAYHLMAAAGWATAPWLITAIVACIPVAVLGMGAALAHLMHSDHAA
ncbi:ABC transporter permease [Actinoplanes sp. NPDC051494]|uniref:ABC transporter permease n=1 Tax=Actinoplanes sp. NPDC051494 TaxID=3363907 RepID=UPI0037AF649A